MAKKKVEPTPFYKSAACGLGNAVTTINKWHEEGYDLVQSFAVVANDEEGKPVQAIWMLGRKRG